MFFDILGRIAKRRKMRSMRTQNKRPFGCKSYGSIPHLPGSRRGRDDIDCDAGHARICLEKTRDSQGLVIVQQKLDGCFAYRTPIYTDQGLIPIGKIVNQRLPVQVLTYDKDRDLCYYAPISEYHKKSASKGWVRVVAKSLTRGMSKRSLICTPDHEILTGNGDTYKQASELAVGDFVYEPALKIEEEAKAAILGMLLGDSSILKAKSGSMGFTIGHSEPQYAYFDFKMQLFSNVLTESTRQKGGFSGSRENRRAHSYIMPDITSLIKNHCIVDESKTVTENWANAITPVSLAFWYMDDGSCKHSANQRPRPRLATNAFSLKETEVLANCLRSKFNIDCKVFDYSGPTIVITADGADRLFDLIYPFVPDCMKYKLPTKYRNRTCVFDGHSFSSSMGIMQTVVTSMETEGVQSWEGSNSMYDLTINDTHNYVACNLIVHNSNVAVGKINGEIIPIVRSGYRADTSPYEQHHHCAKWVYRNLELFDFLEDGERVCGEWLGQAVGTIYDLPHEPFAAFDIKRNGHERASWEEFSRRVDSVLPTPQLIHVGGALSIEAALEQLEPSHHGALEPVEGVVWRVERNGVFDFIAKYVRSDKIDGKYFPEISGVDPIWLWHPDPSQRTSLESFK